MSVFFTKAENGIELADMDLSVTGCMVTAFMSGSVRAEIKLNVTQPAFLMNTGRKITTENLKKWFNVTAAQSVVKLETGSQLSLSVEDVGVLGKASHT